LTHFLLHGHFYLRRIRSTVFYSDTNSSSNGNNNISNHDSSLEKSYIEGNNNKNSIFVEVENFDVAKHEYKVPNQAIPFNPLYDDMKIDCYFSTLDSDSAVSGGMTAEDEMCLAYIGYYPKIQNSPHYCFTNTDIPDKSCSNYYTSEKNRVQVMESDFDLLQ
jgi:hypothetical protein